MGTRRCRQMRPALTNPHESYEMRLREDGRITNQRPQIDVPETTSAKRDTSNQTFESAGGQHRSESSERPQSTLPSFARKAKVKDANAQQRLPYRTHSHSREANAAASTMQIGTCTFAL